MISSGSFSTFALFADSFREKFGLSFSEINIISAVMNSSLYLSYLLVGPIFDVFGVNICQLISAIAFTLGYLLIYLSMIEAIPTNAGALAFYYSIGGFGSCGAYMSMVGANTANFDDNIIGLIGGTLLLFYGIAGVFYSVIFKSFYLTNINGFLLFILLSVGIINFLGAYFVKSVPKQSKQGGTVEELIEYTKLNPIPPDDQNVIATSELINNDLYDVSLRSPQSFEISPRNQDLEERKYLLSDRNTTKSAVPLPLKMPLPSMTPREMLKSPLFWSYAVVMILQQGLTYQVNINAIIQSSLGSLSSAELVTELTAVHVTILSASQSIGRFGFGAGSDVIAKYGVERSVLLVVAEILLFIPPLLLASVENFSVVTSGYMLYFCSFLTGLGISI